MRGGWYNFPGINVQIPDEMEITFGPAPLDGSTLTSTTVFLDRFNAVDVNGNAVPVDTLAYGFYWTQAGALTHIDPIPGDLGPSYYELQAFNGFGGGGWFRAPRLTSGSIALDPPAFILETPPPPGAGVDSIGPVFSIRVVSWFTLLPP